MSTHKPTIEGRIERENSREGRQSEMSATLDRREILRSAAILATGSSVPAGSGTANSTESSSANEEAIPTEPDEIHAAFEDVPRIDDPDDTQRMMARQQYPDVVVPDEGPIPDPEYGRVVTEIEVPEWVLASAYDRAQARAEKHPDREPNQGSVTDNLLSMFYVWEMYRTPDGRDAVEAVLDEVER